MLVEQEFQQRPLAAAHAESGLPPVAALRCAVHASSCWHQVADQAFASDVGLASLAKPAIELVGCRSFAPVERDYRPSGLER